MRKNVGKIGTRITPNTDTFQAMFSEVTCFDMPVVAVSITFELFSFVTFLEILLYEIMGIT